MKAHARFFAIFLIVISIFILASASAEGSAQKSFSADYTAINEAAQSMFLVEIYDITDKLLGTGSGFVAFDEHYFITNYHVIESAAYLKVYDDFGKSYRITELLQTSSKYDLAILKFDEGIDYNALTLNGNSELLRGEPVVAIGSPQGIKNTVSTGIISALLDDNGALAIQFTAAASHGSSGGALFNDNGEVIGLIYAGHKEGENMNYALDISEVISTKAKIHDYSVSLIAFNDLNSKSTSAPSPKPTVFHQKILQIPANSNAEWTTTGNGTQIKIRVEVENISTSYEVSGYKLYISTLDPTTFDLSENDYISKMDVIFYNLMKEKAEKINDTISIGKRKYTPYFYTEMGALTDLFIGIKEVYYSNGKTVIYDDQEIAYAHWKLNIKW